MRQNRIDVHHKINDFVHFERAKRQFTMVIAYHTWIRFLSISLIESDCVRALMFQSSRPAAKWR